jgi:hypothetical protein
MHHVPRQALLQGLALLAACAAPPAWAQQDPMSLESLLASQAPAARGAPQKWRNALETLCRIDKESYEDYQKRLNLRMQALGAAGWEIVGVVNTPIKGNDCLAFAYKQPGGK